MSVYAYLDMYMYISRYVHICIYIYLHTHEHMYSCIGGEVFYDNVQAHIAHAVSEERYLGAICV